MKSCHVRRRVRLLVALLAVTLCCGSVSLLAAQAPPAQTGQGQLPPAQMLEKVAIDQKLDAQVPLDLTFRDEQGQDVKLADLVDGKPVVLSLVYYRCPMLCNMVMDGLVRSLETLKLNAGEDFTVITVSFDPNEGPDLAAGAKRTAMRRYGRPGSEGGWHFLTGAAEASRQLADAVGFRYLWDESRGQYVHAASIMILTPEGHVSRYLYGVEYSPRDLRLALVEASEGKIGTLADHAMLLCYQYDPANGKYGFAVMQTLRVAGMLTVGCLFGGIATLLWRERRRQSPAAVD